MRLTSPAADLPRESRRRDTFLCRSAVSKQLHPLTSQRPSGAAASDQRGSPTASFLQKSACRQNAAGGVASIPPGSVSKRFRPSDQPASQRSSGQRVQRGASQCCRSRSRPALHSHRAACSMPSLVLELSSSVERAGRSGVRGRQNVTKTRRSSCGTEILARAPRCFGEMTPCDNNNNMYAVVSSRLLLYLVEPVRVVRLCLRVGSSRLMRRIIVCLSGQWASALSWGW